MNHKNQTYQLTRTPRQKNENLRMQSNQIRKLNKSIQTGKEEVKSSLFMDDIILYVGNPKKSTITAKTNKFSKVAGSKFNTQTSVVSMH